MTNTQIQGMRDMHNDTKTVLRRPVLSAKEMALTPHKLSRAGDMATTTEGRVYIWDSRFNHWAPWM